MVQVISTIIMIIMFTYMIIVDFKKENDTKENKDEQRLKRITMEGITVNKRIYRGEIYYAKLSGTVGSEQNGNRPVVIVQNNTGNIYSSTVIVAPFTRKIDKDKKQRTHVEVKAFGNIKYDSTILTEQVRTIDKKRLIKRIDKLPTSLINKMDNALAIAQGLKK